jgi:maltooligosyltrehalose trehalohydrolase
MSYKYPDVGALYEGDNTVSFTVWAPERSHIDLVITDSIFPMNKDERGFWHKRLNGIAAGTPYRYRIDKKENFPDPASFSQPEGVHGASVIVDPAYPWTDLSWTGIPLHDMVIYELHVGTFTNEGDFEGVISKLPYLKDLGINTIELMPVAQFPGTRNWGYDGAYPFAVQHSYGGVNGLKHLVDEAHKSGIAVILDVVYNHLGPEGNYFSVYAPYFTDRYKTFWGSAINYDDAWCDGVRHFYWQNAMMWLNDFHIDGLRLDAVHAIWDFSARHFLEELRAKATVLEKQTGRTKTLIAEFDLNNPRYINPLNKGGYGLDGQWIDEYHHALHAVMTGEKDGYYEDFGEISHLAKALRDSYVYTGQYSVHRKKNFGVLPTDNPYSQFVVFAQNHDHIGNRLLGDRLTSQLSFEGLKLTAAAYLLSPHVPLLFMGEEYGEKRPFQYFISHSDQDLIARVREGRKKEFAYFHREGQAPDPQSDQTFQQCKLSWKDEETGSILLSCYKYLIAFRKARKAMKACERNSLIVLPVPEKNILCFEKRAGEDRVLMVLNFNKEQISVANPVKKTLQKLFDSSAQQWNGPGEKIGPQTDAEKFLVLNPESAVVFEY